MTMLRIQKEAVPKKRKKNMFGVSVFQFSVLERSGLLGGGWKREWKWLFGAKYKLKAEEEKGRKEKRDTLLPRFVQNERGLRGTVSLCCTLILCKVKLRWHMTADEIVHCYSQLNMSMTNDSSEVLSGIFSLLLRMPFYVKLFLHFLSFTFP